MVITRGKGEWEAVEKSKWGISGDEGELTLGGEHTIQYTYGIL